MRQAVLDAVVARCSPWRWGAAGAGPGPRDSRSTTAACRAASRSTATSGFPNDEAGGGTAYGVTGAGPASGPFGATATLSTFNPDGPGGSDVSVGGTLNYRLLGGPLVPLSVTLQGGVGYAKPDASVLPDGGLDECPSLSLPGRRRVSRSRSPTRRSPSSRGSRPGSTSLPKPPAAPRDETETNFGLSPAVSSSTCSTASACTRLRPRLRQGRGGPGDVRRRRALRLPGAGSVRPRRALPALLALVLPAGRLRPDLRRHHPRRAGHAWPRPRASRPGRPLQGLAARRCSASGASRSSRSPRCGRRWPRSSAAAAAWPT